MPSFYMYLWRILTDSVSTNAAFVIYEYKRIRSTIAQPWSSITQPCFRLGTAGGTRTKLGRGCTTLDYTACSLSRTGLAMDSGCYRSHRIRGFATGRYSVGTCPPAFSQQSQPLIYSAELALRRQEWDIAESFLQQARGKFPDNLQTWMKSAECVELHEVI